MPTAGRNGTAFTAGTVQAADKACAAMPAALSARSASGWSLIGREARRVGAWRSPLIGSIRSLVMDKKSGFFVDPEKGALCRLRRPL